MMKVTVAKWGTVEVRELGIVLSGWNNIAMFFASVPEGYTDISLLNWKITTGGEEIHGYDDCPFQVRKRLRNAGLPLDDNLTLFIHDLTIYDHYEGGLEFACCLFGWDLAAVEEAIKTARIATAALLRAALYRRDLKTVADMVAEGLTPAQMKVLAALLVQDRLAGSGDKDALDALPMELRAPLLREIYELVGY